MSFAHTMLLHEHRTLEGRPAVESGTVKETASKWKQYRVYQHLDFRKNTALSIARFYL